MSADTEARVQRMQHRVDQQETELRVAVRNLEHAARRAFELRPRFQSHPLLWTTGAFLVGVWLGGHQR